MQEKERNRLQFSSFFFLPSVKQDYTGILREIAFRRQNHPYGMCKEDFLLIPYISSMRLITNKTKLIKTIVQKEESTFDLDMASQGFHQKTLG